MNKPRVAVLLFGQARYIDVNFEALKKEFAFEDGTSFDIFAHLTRDQCFYDNPRLLLCNKAAKLLKKEDG